MGALRKPFWEMLGKELVASHGFIRSKNAYYRYNKGAKYLMQCELNEYWEGRGFNFYIRIEALVEMLKCGEKWNPKNTPDELLPMRPYVLDGMELGKDNDELRKSLEGQLRNRIAYFKENILPVIDTIENEDTFFQAINRLDKMFGYSTFYTPWLYIQQGDFNSAKRVVRSRIDRYDKRIRSLLHIDEKMDYADLKQRHPKEVEEYEKRYGRQRGEYERLLQQLEKGERYELEKEILQREQDAERLCDMYFDKIRNK